MKSKFTLSSKSARPHRRPKTFSSAARERGLEGYFPSRRGTKDTSEERLLRRRGQAVKHRCVWYSLARTAGWTLGIPWFGNLYTETPLTMILHIRQAGIRHLPDHDRVCSYRQITEKEHSIGLLCPGFQNPARGVDRAQSMATCLLYSVVHLDSGTRLEYLLLSRAVMP